MDEKISEGKLIGEKAIIKLRKSVDEAKKEVDEFGNAQRVRELDAVQQAHHPVETLAQEAQAKLGIELTWLDGVTYADWQRERTIRQASHACAERFFFAEYHKLASDASAFREELHGIQQGSRRSVKLARADFEEQVQGLKTDMDQIHTSFVRRLTQMAVAGYNILKGEPTKVLDAASILSKLMRPATAFSDLPKTTSTPGLQERLASAAAAVAGGAAVEDAARGLRGSFSSATEAAGSVVSGTSYSFRAVRFVC